MVIIGIVGKNDVGKSLFCTVGLRDKLDNALYVVCDGAELTLSLKPFEDKVTHKQFLSSVNDLSKLANNVKACKQKIIILDHLGGLVNRVLAESNLDENNVNFNFQLGALVRKRVALALQELIHNCRQQKKILVIICPLDHTSTDDLSKASVSFDTRTAQDVFFNECDEIIHLKRKNYRDARDIEELFKNIEYKFSYPHETQIPLKDKANAKHNPYTEATLHGLLTQIYHKSSNLE